MGKHTIVSSSRSSKMGSGVPASMQLMRMRETPLPQPSMMPSERRAATRIGVVGPRCVASEERAHGPGAGRSAHVVDAEAVGEHAHLHGGAAVVVLVGERVQHGFVHRIPRRSTMATGGAETVGAVRGRLLFR